MFLYYFYVFFSYLLLVYELLPPIENSIAVNATTTTTTNNNNSNDDDLLYLFCETVKYSKALIMPFTYCQLLENEVRMQPRTEMTITGDATNSIK